MSGTEQPQIANAIHDTMKKATIKKASYYFLIILIGATPVILGLTGVLHFSQEPLYRGRLAPYTFGIIILGIASYIWYAVWIYKLNKIIYNEGKKEETTLNLLFDKQATPKGEQARKRALFGVTLFFIIFIIYLFIRYSELQQILF
jgi:hypothetical protein